MQVKAGQGRSRHVKSGQNKRSGFDNNNNNNYYYYYDDDYYYSEWK